MNPAQRIQSIADDLSIPYEDAEALRRCSMTLHRWYGLECGDSDAHCSFCLERDPATGRPYMVTYPHMSGKERRRRVPDREAGASRRVEAICKRLGLHWYFQTDPRGASLYLSRTPLTDQSYSRDGVAVYK